MFRKMRKSHGGNRRYFAWVVFDIFVDVTEAAEPVFSALERNGGAQGMNLDSPCEPQYVDLATTQTIVKLHKCCGAVTSAHTPL